MVTDRGETTLTSSRVDTLGRLAGVSTGITQRRTGNIMLGQTLKKMFTTWVRMSTPSLFKTDFKNYYGGIYHPLMMTKTTFQ